MRYLDLSYEGRQLAERNQQDNGKLPHGGFRGTKKHPPSHLSYEKGREFQQKLDQEMERLFEEEELVRHGTTPTWSLLIHREPSYSDESPLITRNLLAANKLEQANGVNLFTRTSLLPNRCARPIKSNGVMYYRPNRMHQYLSATELKNCAEEEVNIKYGRPTRTTLLRARQRCTSAPTNAYDNKREFLHRLDEIKSTCPVSPSTEYLQLQSVRDGESLHSYLTGARYNRAHCLDSKSVEHSGVYMPRQNPALGSFFTGPKGQEYLQEFLDSPRLDVPFPPTPDTPKQRPFTAPSHGRRAVTAPAMVSKSPGRDRHLSGRECARSAGHSKYKHLTLNIVGSRLPIGLSRETGLKLPSLQGAQSTDRVPKSAVEETFKVNQPPPTPTSVKQASQMSEQAEVPAENTEKVVEPAASVPVVAAEAEKEEEIEVVEEKKEEEKAEEILAEDQEQNVSGGLVTVPRVQAESPAVEDEGEDNEEEAMKEENVKEDVVRDKGVEDVVKEEDTKENVVQEEDSTEKVADENVEKGDADKEIVEDDVVTDKVDEVPEQTADDAGDQTEDHNAEEQNNKKDVDVVKEIVNEEVVEGTEEEAKEKEESLEHVEEGEGGVKEVVEETKVDETTNDEDNKVEDTAEEAGDVNKDKYEVEEVVEEEVEEEYKDDFQEEEDVEDSQIPGQETAEEAETKEEAPVKEVRFFITEEGSGAKVESEGNIQKEEENDNNTNVTS